ncbi:MAG TPA: hypothetical protein VME66_00935 [Candidatus Acidoferrales bacterium]|nr:hypothetical protein [Candidatus Acidoferrales bacterium]
MEPLLHTDTTNDWLLLHDSRRDTWILFVPTWVNEPSIPLLEPADAPDFTGLDDDQEQMPYALPVLVLFWFASFAWGLWYITNSS